MRQTIPFFLILTALVLTLLSLFGEGGFSQLHALRVSLEKQREKNGELKQHVGDLRHEIYAVQHDDRSLEKTARNELGMARPDEMIFFFDQSKKRE